MLRIVTEQQQHPEQEIETLPFEIKGWGTITYPDGTVPVDDPEAWNDAQH